MAAQQVREVLLRHVPLKKMPMSENVQHAGYFSLVFTCRRICMAVVEEQGESITSERGKSMHPSIEQYLEFLHTKQSEPAWMNQMTKEDLRGLTPLIYSNVNPYGLIRLNMAERLMIERAEAV